MHTPVTWIGDVWSSEAFVRKCFFRSFLLTDILLTSILTSLHTFLSFFTDVPVVVLASLEFMVFIDDQFFSGFTVSTAVSLGDILGSEPITLIR